MSARTKVLARDLSTRLYDGQIIPWMGRSKKFNRNSC